MILKFVENPADPAKLLIGFSSGVLSLWDLNGRKQVGVWAFAMSHSKYVIGQLSPIKLSHWLKTTWIYTHPCNQEELYQCPKKFTSISWHYDGKQFVCSCVDGSLVTWNIKPVNKKPVSVVFPHREKGSDISEPLSPIDKVILIIFRVATNTIWRESGGMHNITFSWSLSNWCPRKNTGTPWRL